MKRIILGLVLFSSALHGQKIENKATLHSFFQKLKENKDVSRILMLGDSHIQAGYISEFLRSKFQATFGNAGRGTLFPYALANSNGPQDFSSVSNAAWVTFRSVYEQNIYPQMGALGFVMGNNVDSFIEISFKNEEDKFDFFRTFSDEANENQSFQIFKHPKSLKDFVTTKKTRLN